MPKLKKDEEATGVASLESAKSGGPVKYWSPECEELIVGKDSIVKFEDHVVIVGEQTAKKMEQFSSFGRLFYRVDDRAGDEKYKEVFLKYLRNLVGGDPLDQVKTERGLMAVMALFSPEELAELDISRSLPNEDRLILAAINNKYVEGIL
jgi:hypothetical protein